MTSVKSIKVSLVGVNISQLLNPIYPGDFVKRTTMAFLSAIAVFSPIVWLQPASAASFASIRVSSGSCVDNHFVCDSQDDYSYSYNGNVLRDILTLSTSASFGGGSSRSDVTASFGTVRASSFVQDKVYTGSGSRGDVNDSFTVGSSTLQSGTPVTLLFTWSIDGSLLFNNSDQSSSADAYSFFRASEYFGNDLLMNYSTPSRSDGSAPIQVNQVLTGRLNTTVGQEISLLYGLSVGSYINGANINGVPVTLSASADFGHTARFFADSETAGVILTSSSGHNYASPVGESVPTPALIPGLIALGATLRRQRQKACA
jgi:hypothetical protein